MMAAHEALQTLALSHRDPATLFALANRRLYKVGGKKSFVALGWVAATDDGDGIDYLVAGQPQLLRAHLGGAVRELPLPPHRLPLGALLDGGYVAQPRGGRAGRRRARLFGRRDRSAGPGRRAVRRRDACAGVERRPGGPRGDHPAGSRSRSRSFTRGADPYDDITLVAIARDGGGEACDVVL